MVENLPLDRHAMKDKATSHLRIYVGNISDKITDGDLYDHFKEYGTVTGVVVNRNFGFVQFEEEASAQAAINKSNGANILGKTINVRTAQIQNNTGRSEPIQVKNDIPPAVPLTDNTPAEEDDDQYDSFGNFIGEKNYREEDYRDEGWADEGNSHGARGGPRGRMPRGGRGRGVRGGRGGPPGFHDRSPVPRGVAGGEWPERGGYERFSQPEYPRALPVPERNDCEIIVVSKLLTEYAEYIEGRLKRLGIVVDLLYPMEDVPIGKVLGNIASRGCLYAILVMPQNQENRSLTLTILHGLPQEHRNMPLEDSLQLLSRNFQEVQRGGPSGREAVYALLGQLADGRTLTVLQYDKVMEYLQERREQQVKIELGEPLNPAPASKTQVDLQERILSILNDKKVVPQAPVPVPVPAPAPVPQQNKLLNDPTVRKALDSILQKFV